MNLWVRIYSLVESDGCSEGALSLEIASRLHIVLHRSEESAREAAARCGGIVLEVAASSLKALHEFDDLLLVGVDRNDSQEDGRAPSNAFITVCCKDIPHEWDAKLMVMNFKPEGEAYLEALEKEIGAELCQ